LDVLLAIDQVRKKVLKYLLMSLKMCIQHPKFWPLFWTQFFGALNDNLLKNALILLVTFKGIAIFGLEIGSLVAVAGGIFILPFFLFSPIAGSLADKYEKAQLIRIVKMAEVLIMVVAGLGFYFQMYELLIAILFFMGMQSSLFGPVKYSVLPEILPDNQLVEGNAYVEMGTFLAILIGTIAGGFAVAVENGEWLIIIGLQVFALLGLATSYKMPFVGRSAPDLKIKLNPLPEYVFLWKLLKEKKAIFNSVLGISWFWFFQYLLFQAQRLF